MSMRTKRFANNCVAAPTYACPFWDLGYNTQVVRSTVADHILSAISGKTEEYVDELASFEGAIIERRLMELNFPHQKVYATIIAVGLSQGWAKFFDHGPHSASFSPWRALQCVLGSLAGRIYLNHVKMRGSYMYFYRGCRSI